MTTKRAAKVLPDATLAARKLVGDALASVVGACREEYRAHFRQVCLDQIAFAEARLSAEDVGKVRRSVNPILFDKAFDLSGFGKQAKAQRRVDWKTRVIHYADRRVEAIFSAFLSKNTEKLASIVELKGGPSPSISLASAKVYGGVLETTMSFSFPDGATFEVRNSVVGQRSVHGLWYERFPTTFHGVILASGSKIASPSELDMKTVFVGVSAGEEEVKSPQP
jgi:hypothetical protein